MLLAIDVGNTNITMGVFDGKDLIGDFRLTTKSPRTSDEFGVVIRDILRQNGIHHHPQHSEGRKKGGKKSPTASSRPSPHGWSCIP